MLERDAEGRVIRQSIPLAGTRKLIAERMTYSVNHFPQGTAIVALDAGKLIQFRNELKEKNIKVSFGDLFVKASACALEKVPELNGSRLNDKIVYYRSVNIGMMANINGNLMEPIITEVQSKTVEDVSVELSQIYEYLRKGKLMRVKLDGSTFSISNLGMYPMDGFTPMLSPPNGAILGVGRIRRVPAFDEVGNLVARDEISVSVTSDHGLVDGAKKGEFIRALKEVVDDPWTYMYQVSQPEVGDV